MEETIKVRWLEDHEQNKIAPKTLVTQVLNENGSRFKDSFDTAILEMTSSIDEGKRQTCDHINNTDVHVTQEEKDTWSNIVNGYATEEYVTNLYQKLNSNTILGFYCIEPVTIITNGVSHTYPANSNVEIAFIEDDVFEIVPTSDNSILSLTAFPNTLGTFYPWLEGVAQFSNILFDMNDEAMYSKWSQGNQGSYHVQKAQYVNCIFWSDNPYISDVSKRTNYTLTHTSQLPLCYSTIPDNTFKAFYLAFGVTSDPNWGNQAYRDSFAKATWATQVFSYYGARTIGIVGHDDPDFNIVLPKDCRGLMFDARHIENAGTFDAINVTNFGAKSGSWREAFGFCSSLKRLFIKNLKVGLNVSWSPIDHESITYIISAAANTNKITISVSPYTYNLLSQEDFDLATSKNITIALISTNYVEDKRLQTIANKADKSYVDEKIANLINSAPETLDTLGELATAFQENDEVIDVLNQAITTKADKTDIPDIPVTSVAHQMLVTDENGDTVWEEKLCYDVLQEMTFLEEDVLYPSFGNTFEHYGYSAEQEFILGETYKVNLDGTVYECVAKYDDGMGYMYLGNGDLNGCAEATDDPFVLFNLEPGVAAFCTLANPDGDHTLSVVGNGYAKKPINGDYIAGGLYKGSGANSTHTKENEADGMNAFAIGSGTKASNYASFATGESTEANGAYSVTEGQGTVSTASAQHVQGKYNIEDTEGQYAHIVGNGKREYGVTTRSNAHTIDWNGNAWFAGKVYVGGTSQDDATELRILSDEQIENVVGKYLDENPVGGNEENICFVNFLTEDGENWTADKTYTELLTAYLEGQMLYAKIMNVTLPIVNCDENAIVFQTVVNDSGAIGFITATVGSDDSAIMSIDAKPCGITLVNITMTSDTEGTADKSFAELREAANTGMPIYANITGMIVPAHSISETDITFHVRMPAEEGIYANIMVTLSDSDTVSANVQMEGGSIVYVTVSSNGAAQPTYSADMTLDEIFAAYSMGKTVICKAEFGNISDVCLTLSQCHDTVASFIGFLDFTGLGHPVKQLCSVIITNETIVKYQSSMDEFPNPYSLKINGTEYDGSKAVTINIEVPTKLSDLEGDENHRIVTDTEKEAWNTKSVITDAEKASWNAKSDFSGSYNDLTDKPTIPDKLSDLTADSEHRTVTDTEKIAWNAKSDFSGSYNDLTDKPTISTVPTKVSEFENDAGYLTQEQNSNLVNGSAIGSLRTLYSKNESDRYSIGEYAVAEGYQTTALGESSHAEGRFTYAIGQQSHAEGSSSMAFGAYSHVEGVSSIATIYLTGDANSTVYTYTLGSHTYLPEAGMVVEYDGRVYIEIISANASTITLSKTLSSDNALNNMSCGLISYGALGNSSHAEGMMSCAKGHYSHAEGYTTKAGGRASHAEGEKSQANGAHSHAEGHSTQAIGARSHSEGFYTIAQSLDQHVHGKYNIPDAIDKYSTIIGNGEDEDNRSNAHTLDWDGNAWFAGDVYVGSTSGINKDEGSKKLATEEYVNIRVPAWTDADEGKVLKIVNGVPTWASLINYITFTVEDYGEYTAKEGMTWEEWCSSEYNTYHWMLNERFNSNSEITYGDEWIVDNSGTRIKGTDIIINNYEYSVIRDSTV